MSKTLKARERHGADSLDLTIPTKVVRKNEISKGDVFKLTVETYNENLKLIYERVYQKE